MPTARGDLPGGRSCVEADASEKRRGYVPGQCTGEVSPHFCLNKPGRKLLAWSMKLFSLAALSSLLCFSFLSASPPDPKGDAKITKNEAEHIALMRYPGARVTAAKLDKVKGRLVWLIEIAPPKSKPAVAVTVDAMIGRIVSE